MKKALAHVLFWLSIPFVFAFALVARRNPPTPLPPQPEPPRREPLAAGDVLHTVQGPLSVLGVDENGVAWCRPMTRLTGQGTGFQPGIDGVYRFLATEVVEARIPGCKHSFGGVAS